MYQETVDFLIMHFTVLNCGTKYHTNILQNFAGLLFLFYKVFYDLPTYLWLGFVSNTSNLCPELRNCCALFNKHEIPQSAWWKSPMMSSCYYNSELIFIKVPPKHSPNQPKIQSKKWLIMDTMGFHSLLEHFQCPEYNLLTHPCVESASHH